MSMRKPCHGGPASHGTERPDLRSLATRSAARECATVDSPMPPMNEHSMTMRSASATTAPAPVAGVIVAGGRASRMGGRDKAFAAVGGEPIAVRTIRLFHDLFPQVLVATNRPERFRGLGVETVADRFPGCGPLAGIHAALLAARHPYAFVAACDMPGLDPHVIRFLLARIGGADAVVPRWQGDVEPLHAVYAARCLPATEASLRAGRPTLRDFLGTIRVDYVSEAELGRVRGAAASLVNVNTPEELAAVGGRFEEPEG